MRKWRPGSFQRRIGYMRTLLNMARAWPLLAEQAEKNSETVYETHGIQHD